MPKLQQVSWFTYLPDLQSSKVIKDIKAAMSRDRMQPATVGPLAQVCSARSAQWEAGLIDLVVSFAMPFSCYMLLLLLMLCGTLSLGFSGPALLPML